MECGFSEGGQHSAGPGLLSSDSGQAAQPLSLDSPPWPLYTQTLSTFSLFYKIHYEISF